MLASVIASEAKQSDSTMISIFKAPTETEAYMVKGLLESEGMKVFINSWQVPSYLGDANLGGTLWGEICVNESDAKKAKEFLDNYLTAKDS